MCLKHVLGFCCSAFHCDVSFVLVACFCSCFSSLYVECALLFLVCGGVVFVVDYFIRVFCVPLLCKWFSWFESMFVCCLRIRYVGDFVVCCFSAFVYGVCLPCVCCVLLFVLSCGFKHVFVFFMLTCFFLMCVFVVFCVVCFCVFCLRCVACVWSFVFVLLVCFVDSVFIGMFCVPRLCL